MAETVTFRIRRRDRPDSTPYWQDFEVACEPTENVLSVLLDLREHPVTSDGARVEPVTWEHNCMEEVCGACAMMINGQPRMACSTLLKSLGRPVVLEPLAKFPVVRDLLVDRSRIQRSLQQVHAWVEIDGGWDIHRDAPRISPAQWSRDYLYSRCMSCGCCLAACPEISLASAFVGPAALAQVRLMNAHPTGAYQRAERLHAIMGEGGLSDCGNAQNCVRVCPKEIPLTTAIGELGRQTTVQILRDLLGGL